MLKGLTFAKTNAVNLVFKKIRCRKAIGSPVSPMKEEERLKRTKMRRMQKKKKRQDIPKRSIETIPSFDHAARRQEKEKEAKGKEKSRP